MSLYPRVQESIGIQRNLSDPSRTFVSSPGEPGLIATYFEWLADKSGEISEKVPPFKQLIVLSEWLAKRGRKIKVIFGMAGASVAVLFIYGDHDAGSRSAGFVGWLKGLFGVHVSWVLLLTGFAAGSFALSFAGGLIEFGIRWLLLFVVWGMYAIAALFLDWPIPFV